MKTNKIQTSQRRHGGFSLVEVTLALGIVAFAVVTLIGLLGTLLDADDSVTDRRDAIQCIDSLHQYLGLKEDPNSPGNLFFNEIYTWAQADEWELAYVTYYSDADGNPDRSVKSVRSVWLDQDEFSNFTTYDSAREGNWIKIRLTLAGGPGSDGANPVDKSDLPPEADNYPHAYLVFIAEAYGVANPNVSPWELDPPQNPVFTAPITVLR